LLDWLYTAISWVMKTWHSLFSNFLDPAGGLSWALAIAFLVVTIRLLLFRLFVKQVKSQRAMQEIQPEIQKLRKQYGSDKQGFSAAMMALQKERGVNPLAGCLPLLPQIPVFISLFHVLRRLTPTSGGLYSWSTELTHQAATAKLFGAPISSSFNMKEPKLSQILAIPASYTDIRIVCAVLIVVMCCTTFFTQKQIQKRSGPVEGQAATVQKLLLYGMPVSLLVSGFFFPVGVLIYWLINNLWTLGQQFYILKKLPPPGSPAALAKSAADKPQIDPKALAPKPGAKPVRPRPGRSLTADTTPDDDGVIEGSVEEAPLDGGPTGAAATGRPSGGSTRARTGPSGSRSAPGSAGPANRGKRKRR
jgi:YidC/Oxa1 family membrane protein insertase